MTHTHDNKALKSLAAATKQVETMAEDTTKPQFLPLDTEDSLRLDNMLLRSRLASMSSILAEKQAKENQEEFHAHLIRKFGVDISKHQVHVDPEKKTVAIVPR